ncbi:asparagine synthase (glutamine-hydrolyzing) [Gemmatimonadota bacterium]
MCGIAGVLFVHPRKPTSSQEGRRGALGDWAVRMASTLSHRGPDGSATWVSPDGRCGLAHTRLKVIDLDTGDQPMGNEDGSVQVVFNGEIYNFRELRTELEGAGHRFRTRSDTEVIVHGWEEWGEELPDRLDGMFALAAWDGARSQLFLARDRAGKKPLFLYEDDDRIAFASEMKALLALPGVDETLDPRAIPLYLAFGYIPTPGTFHQRIRKLPPATSLLLRPDGGRRQRTYWSLDWTPKEVGPEAASSGLRELMTRAVEKRLTSDVPLGAFLSGGIDSTVVVGLMSRLMSEPVRTFSIGMADDPTYDETHFARMAAKRFNTQHTSFTMEAQEVSLLDELLDAYDEPFGDSSALPTHIVSRLTRGEVTVALTGDGGDEMFGGYPRFAGMMVADRMPGWMVGLGNALGRRLPYHPNFRSPGRRFSTARVMSSRGCPSGRRTHSPVGGVLRRPPGLPSESGGTGFPGQGGVGPEFQSSPGTECPPLSLVPDAGPELRDLPSGRSPGEGRPD